MPEPDDPNIQSRDDAPTRAHGELVSRLTGSLPCARCRYELRGLSIRGTCPECGLPVQATLLAVIDPHASELQPVSSPRLRAAGLVLWSLGAVIAACCVWVARLADIAEPGGRLARARWPAWCLLAGVVISGLGAVALIRPHKNAPRRSVVLGSIGIVLYFPLLVSIAWISLVIDGPGSAPPYVLTESVSPMRVIWHAVAMFLFIAVVMCLRPNARLLVARCLVLRSGRVDRQTLLAIALAASLALLGDLAHLLPGLFGSVGLASWGRTMDSLRPALGPGGSISIAKIADSLSQLLWWFGTVAIAVSSMFVTVGLFSALIDSMRIARSLTVPSPTLGELTAQEPTR